MRGRERQCRKSDARDLVWRLVVKITTERRTTRHTHASCRSAWLRVLMSSSSGGGTPVDNNEHPAAAAAAGLYLFLFYCHELYQSIVKSRVWICSSYYMQSLAQLLNDGGHYTVNEDVTLHWDEAKCYLQLSSNWNNQRKPYLPRQYISTASVGSEELYTNEFNWTRKEEENIWKSRRIAIGLVTSCDMARRSIERAEHSLNIIGLHNIKKLLIFFEKKSQKLRGVYFSTRWISSRKAPHLHTRPGVVARVRTHTQSYIYIYTCAHTHCVYICCCVCFQIASLLFTSQQPALLFFFSR